MSDAKRSDEVLGRRQPAPFPSANGSEECCELPSGIYFLAFYRREIASSQLNFRYKMNRGLGEGLPPTSQNAVPKMISEGRVITTGRLNTLNLVNSNPARMMCVLVAVRLQLQIELYSV